MAYEKHHFNAKVLLRRFTADRSIKQLWEYDLQNRSVRYEHYENVGFQKHLYSVVADGGQISHEAVEKAFNRAENFYHPLIEKLRNKTALSKKDWRNFFLLTSLQKIRSPKFIAGFHSLVQQIVSRHMDSEAYRKELEDQLGLSESEIESATAIVSKRIAIELLIEKGCENLIRKYSRMNWAFVVAEDSEFFVLSDDPVAHFPRDEPFTEVSLTGRDLEICYPLTKKICAFGSRSTLPPQLYNPAYKGLVAEFNRRQIETASQFVYSPHRIPELDSLMTAH